MTKHNVWMSVSDLMTGLMVIFLFIAISYISRVKKNQNVLSDYVETRQKLHDKLVNEFKGDTAVWQMSIGKDLSMKFNNPNVLFASSSYELTPQFKSILDQFLPKYLDILLNDSLKRNIQEIRIEGHTDDVKYNQYDKDPYIANTILASQNFPSPNSMQYKSTKNKIKRNALFHIPLYIYTEKRQRQSDRKVELYHL